MNECRILERFILNEMNNLFYRKEIKDSLESGESR